jgi:3-hydroxyisobutyrate dehydrogenase-like beta-hydroxyacid dehydrogenase
VYQKCQPIFGELASKTFYLGPSGAGATMKLCVNTLLGLGVQALAEAVALGVKAGLPRERFLQVLGETAVVSPSQKSKLDNVRKDDYPAAFALRLMFKDLRLIAELAADLSVPMPAAAAAVQVAATEHAHQLAAHTDEDFSVVVRTMERLAGITLEAP